ncbi:MAG: hypothetical protein MI802_28680 [Desulfobacterales bacterium]|nr:hypothetical protein [Desulfobacterales bacterium]
MTTGSAPIKGNSMKIDTSTITLAADVRQSTTTETERESTIQYWHLDNPDTIVLSDTTYAAAAHTAEVQWSESKTVNNQTVKEEKNQNTANQEAANPFNDACNLQTQLTHLDIYLDESTFNGLSERAVRMLEMTRMFSSFEPNLSVADASTGEKTEQPTVVRPTKKEIPADQDALAEEIEKIAGLLEKAHDEINTTMQPLSLNMPLFFISDPQFHVDLTSQQLATDLNPSPVRPDEVGEYGYAVSQKARVTYEETEQVNFSADGVVRTQDGRELPFTLGLQLDRRLFMEEDAEFFEAGTYTRTLDPLIINLDGGIPQLSDFTFNLDLDFDGEEETLQGLAQGSGYLCFDKNGDGIINDGSELFGPETNNGFEELSRYDSDNNLWIDENDEIWDSLSFWEHDGDTGMQLTKLSDTGLGAIYLDHMDTPFNIKDEKGNLKARISDSGLALNEDGTAASVQEIHWAV